MAEHTEVLYKPRFSQHPHINRLLCDGNIKQIYLAGPMRGLPLFNFPAFATVATRLRAMGLTVINPAEADIAAGYSETVQRPWVDCVVEDIRAVLASDAVVVLPGWEASRGTACEIVAALGADNIIHILGSDTLSPIVNPLERIARHRQIERGEEHSLDPTPYTAKEEHSLDPTPYTAKGMRQFETGATRNVSSDKHDYDGFLSPHAIEVFGSYMHKHRLQANGEVRDSDNWQKGIPLNEYLKSSWRHFLHFWRLHRGYETRDEKGALVTMEDTLGALMFNVMGYCHEYIKSKTAPRRVDG